MRALAFGFHEFLGYDDGPRINKLRIRFGQGLCGNQCHFNVVVAHRSRSTSFVIVALPSSEQVWATLFDATIARLLVVTPASEGVHAL